MKLLALILSLSLWAFPAFAERNPKLPEPYETPSTPNPAKILGWPAGKTPVAPAGFRVSLFAELESPRLMYLLPSGDVLVSQASRNPEEPNRPSPNRITKLKMEGSELLGTEIFAENLNLPFGMALAKDQFFVGEPDRVLKFHYRNGKLVGKPKVIAELPFPKPQRHWTRFLLLNSAANTLYVAVGSASNVGENGDPLDPRNAAILRMDLDGSHQSIVASGLRNPVSLAWEPDSRALWAVVNERDELGDKLVPDYITSVAKGGFYGWPYSYWGRHPDPRRLGERLDLVEKARKPDFSTGSHTASLGIVFTANTTVPAPFAHGAFVTEHGSWNSSSLVGYKVIYVPFEKGQAMDGEKDFLTGFIADLSKSTVYGRPVATLILKDGSLLVSDDGDNKIWKVTPEP